MREGLPKEIYTSVNFSLVQPSRPWFTVLTVAYFDMRNDFFNSTGAFVPIE